MSKKYGYDTFGIEIDSGVLKQCKHKEVMLCWGLLASIRNSTKHECGWCEVNNEHTREEWQAWWKEQRAKEKVWSILSAETR